MKSVMSLLITLISIVKMTLILEVTSMVSYVITLLIQLHTHLLTQSQETLISKQDYTKVLLTLLVKLILMYGCYTNVEEANKLMMSSTL